MKLFYYEYCPFCARVRMALNLKSIKADRVVLPADDEHTLKALVGKHQIPVLLLDDGHPMTESMEIVRYLDGCDGRPRIAHNHNPALEAWSKAVTPALLYLGYPRWTRIGLAEFSTPEAYEHFRAKKTQDIGDFHEAVRNTKAKAAEVSEKLKALPAIVDLAAQRTRLNEADILLFPILRALSVVKAVEWPEGIRDYADAIADETGLDTFFDRAL